MGRIEHVKNHGGGKTFTYIENGTRVSCFLNGNPSINEMAEEGKRMLAAQILTSMRNSVARGKKRSGKKRSGKKRSGKKRSGKRTRRG